MSRPRHRSVGTRLMGAVAATYALWLATAAGPGRAAEDYSEDAVKAAFVYRFAGYVEWPEDSAPAQSFTIAVLGANEVAARLQALIGERSLRGKRVQVQRVSSIQEAGTAQILYIGAAHRGDLKTLVQGLGQRRVLTVSNEDQGLEMGSAINLITVDHRVRFEVSVDAARHAGLQVSSELLSVAARVLGARLPADVACAANCPAHVAGAVPE